MDVIPGEVGVATRRHEVRKAFGDFSELRNLSDVELVRALVAAQGEREQLVGASDLIRQSRYEIREAVDPRRQLDEALY